MRPPTSTTRALLDHVATWRRQALDGTLRVLFLGADSQTVSADEVRASFDVGESIGVVDELFLRHVVSLVAQVGTPAVAMVIARRDGSARRCDRRLAQELQKRLAVVSVRLVAVLVVGEQCHANALPRPRTTIAAGSRLSA